MATKNYVNIFASFLLVIIVLTATSSVTLAFSGKDAAIGEIVVSGNSDGSGSYVMLDGQKAYNGRSFVSSGTITTEDVAAIVKLKDLGSIVLAPHTTLNLSIADGVISGSLSGGKIKVANMKGVKVDITTDDSKISSDGKEDGVFGVNLMSGKTEAVSEAGALTINNGTNSTVLTPKQDDDDDDPNILPLVLIFAGIVGVAVWVAVSNRDNDELGTISAIS